jgi:two-component system response regulator MprA
LQVISKIVIHKTVGHYSTTATTVETGVSRVLVVEDRREVLEVLRRTLADSGYEVHTAADGESAIEKALDLHPDIVILDIGLPKRSGIEVARELRSRAFLAPLLMLTARDTIGDRVEGLDAGADDYLVKPFDYDELLARVRALLRRSAIRTDATVLRAGDLTIDLLTREVKRGSRTILLTQKEYALLEYLVRHAGHPVTREQISEQVWKQELDPATNIVDVYINYLRKKVDAERETPLVQTVRGVGYMVRAEPAGR